MDGGQKAGSALVCLVVALIGALIAYLWFGRHRWLAVTPFAVLFVVGYLCDSLARTRLLPLRPVAAVWCMESWLLVPGVGAALTSAALIFLGVWLEPSQTATVQQKKLLGAVFGALAAFAATLIVTAAQDADTNFMAGHVRKTFQAHYKRPDPVAAQLAGPCYFRPDSDGERWVYSDSFGGITGWGWTARHVRARNIAGRLTQDRV